MKSERDWSRAQEQRYKAKLCRTSFFIVPTPVAAQAYWPFSARRSLRVRSTFRHAQAKTACLTCFSNACPSRSYGWPVMHLQLSSPIWFVVLLDSRYILRWHIAGGSSFLSQDSRCVLPPPVIVLSSRLNCTQLDIISDHTLSTSASFVH